MSLLGVLVEDDVPGWAAAPFVVPQWSVLESILFQVIILNMPEVFSNLSFVFTYDCNFVNSSFEAWD